MFLMVFGAALLMPACSSFLKTSIPKNVPKEVKKAIKSAPKSALIGIGKTTATGTSTLTEATALTRARTEISRQLNTMVRDMVTMYEAGSALDANAALSFQENITVALSASTLVGSTVLLHPIDVNGIYWAVIGLTRKEANNEIKRAQELAMRRMNMPQGNKVDITVNFDKAFDKAVEAGPQF